MTSGIAYFAVRHSSKIVVYGKRSFRDRMLSVAHEIQIGARDSFVSIVTSN